MGRISDIDGNEVAARGCLRSSSGGNGGTGGTVDWKVREPKVNPDDGEEADPNVFIPVSPTGLERQVDEGVPCCDDAELLGSRL